MNFPPKGQLREAKARHTTVTSFLESGTVPPRSDLRQHLSAARQQREHYTAELEHLHSESGVRNDRVTLLRGLLTIAQGDAADVEEEIDQLTRVQHDRTSRIDRLHREITRLERFPHANGALADVEFAVCPRCMQSIAERHVEEGACRLCVQPEPEAEPEAPRRRSGRSRQPSTPDDALPLVVPDRSSAQAEQLATQREETNRLLMLGERELWRPMTSRPAVLPRMSMLVLSLPAVPEPAEGAPSREARIALTRPSDGAWCPCTTCRMLPTIIQPIRTTRPGHQAIDHACVSKPAPTLIPALTASAPIATIVWANRAISLSRKISAGFQCSGA
ncbi:hypothetical protein LP52_15710 [Streptomonospora alba]|uniref:Uncharacterized protein n=1 Tax=Streptomonospora alba TaxID=183763 RepID=A0A0C2JGU9_9ACTN|nr:hypothetical protein [Streptomonospora alba]KIH98120.1 hypothetical protein LP52_15710 [Streptomonospora alba]